MKNIFTLLIFLGLSLLHANAQSGCNSWVRLNDRFAAVTVGDLDVTGDQITVEALFNMTGPSVNIVSKHWGGFDVNYLLRPVRGEITTTETGFVVTDAGAFPCDDSMELNKTYHVALVYNGRMLKFYRNGNLVSEVPATGDLVTNDWNTAIGEHAPVVTPVLNGSPNPNYQNQNESQGFYDESFRGFINEVRIWNVARTQDEIRAHMNRAIANPANELGLLGYWIFDSLQNRQGNNTYNGTIEGLATIGQSNTTCNCIPVSCKVPLPLQYINFNADPPVENEGITLRWQAEGENGIQNYSLQRAESPDFSSFTTVAVINALNTTGAIQNYSYKDTPPTSGEEKKYYYRLEMNAFSIPKSYSAVIEAKLLPGSIITNPAPVTNGIYPNPSKTGIFNCSFISNTDQSGLINVYDAIGHLVHSAKIHAVTGHNSIPLNLSTLQNGAYFVRLMLSGNTTFVKSILRN